MDIPISRSHGMTCYQCSPALHFDLFLIEVGYALRIFETCLSCIFPIIFGSTSLNVIRPKMDTKKLLYTFERTPSLFLKGSFVQFPRCN